MEQMTLSRALRYKKRVVETIRRLENDVCEYNSRIEGTESETNVRGSFALRQKWVSHLIDLKLKIQEATRPIQRMVLELAETKSQIAFVQRISTNHGPVADKWENKTTNYFSDIRRAEKDSMVVELQAKIDSLQTKIDEHNTKTLISVEVPEFTVQ